MLLPLDHWWMGSARSGAEGDITGTGYLEEWWVAPAARTAPHTKQVIGDGGTIVGHGSLDALEGTPHRTAGMAELSGLIEFVPLEGVSDFPLRRADEDLLLLLV